MKNNKQGHWETYYVCSVCGEHSSFKDERCLFCHSVMDNPEQVIELCEKRNRDKCSYYCNGFDVTCEDYEPTK